MAGPIITGLAFSATVIFLSFWRPNTGRIVLGFFFIVMGLGINLTFVLTNPNFIAEYGSSAWLPLYRILTERIIAVNPLLFGILLIIFEIIMGCFLLSKGIWVKLGLIGTMIFVLMLVPIALEQIVWAAVIVANIYLLTKNFDTSFPTMLRARFRKRV